MLLACCGDERSGYPLAVRWSFADGRSCADAGVASVKVFDADSLVPRAVFGTCVLGMQEALSVGLVPGGERAYDIHADSPAGGTLYRARVSVDAAATPEVDVVLSFSGG